jgi:hypothetical protein
MDSGAKTAAIGASAVSSLKTSSMTATVGDAEGAKSTLAGSEIMQRDERADNGFVTDEISLLKEA